MLRNLIFICLVYLALIVQPAVRSQTSIIPFQPWLPGLALLLGVTCVRGTVSLVGIAVLGLGVDCLTNGRPGVHLLIATTIAFCLLPLGTVTAKPGLLLTGIMTIVATFGWRLLAASWLILFEHQSVQLARITVASFVEAISNCAIAMFVLLVSRLIEVCFHRQKSQPVSLSNQWMMLTDQ